MINIYNLGADDEDQIEIVPEVVPVKIKDTNEINISLKHEAKGKNHDIYIKTKLNIRDGFWDTILTVNGKEFPVTRHSVPISVIDEGRDKHHFLAKMANKTDLTQKQCQSIMYEINDLAKVNEEFESSITLYESEEKRREESTRLAREEAEANQPKKESPKLQGCHIPSGYDILTTRDRHICGEIIQRVYTAADEVREIPVCACRAMVTGLHTSCDADKTLVELSFTVYDNKTQGAIWKTIVVPFSSIMTRDGFKKDVMSKGFGVQEANINECIAYLEACIAVNAGKPNTEFKATGVSEITGWTNDRFDEFKLGNRRICNENGTAVIRDEICINDELVGKLIPQGTVEQWVKCIKPVAHFKRMRFLMYDAMASVLLRVLKVSPHAGMLIYPTSEGKTTALQVIASMIGSPDEYGEGLLYSGDISITGANAILHMYQDLPTLFDETTNASDKFRKTFTYLVGNAAAPIRGKQGGELRDRENHRTNSYIAAEESMTPKTMNDGGNNRAVQYKERLVPSGHGEIIDTAKLCMQYNYGHILPRFIEKIFMNMAGLRAYFENSKARLAKLATDDRVKRQAATFAAAETSGMLLEQVFVDIGMDEPYIPEKLVNQMWVECMENAEKPMAYHALSDFDDWWKACFNQNGLLHDETTEMVPNRDGEYSVRPLHKGKIFIWDEAIWVDVLKSELDAEFTRKGYTNIDGIYKHWRRVYGIMEVDSTENRHTKHVKHMKSIDSSQKDQVRVIRIIKDKMYDILGMLDQEEPIKESPKQTNIDDYTASSENIEEFNKMFGIK